MHVLLLVGDLAESSGGPPRVVVGLANALVETGDKVTIYTLGEGAERDRHIDPRVDVVRFPTSRPRRLGRSRAMAQALRATVKRFDVLHCHGVWEGCLAQGAEEFARAGKPVFVSAHGMLDRWSLAQSSAKKALALRLLGTGRMLARAHVVFGTEDEASKAQVAALGTSIVVPNGVDVSKLDIAVAGNAAPLLSRAPQVASWDVPILYFARIHPKKGLDLLVDAFIAVGDDHPESGLLIVGIPEDDDYLTQIRTHIAESGLSERIAVVTDLNGQSALPALRMAGIFVLPSHQEGFSIALIEAMAAGVPILATDQCHFPEIATERAGVIIPDSADGVRAGLSELLAMSQHQRTAMGHSGRALVEREYTLKAVARRQRAAYATAIGEKLATANG